MKITVLGGGGVRSPLLARTLIKRAKSLNIDNILFMDNDEEKLRVYGGIAKKIALLIDSSVNFELTTDAAEAIKDADYIITTLRVGQDQGRIYDERIALSLGVTGQETTGAGGFAMAMRSIPALKEYCLLAQKYARPNVLIFNFTNPSGLVTQALRNEGFKNVYGVCDGPSEFIKEIETVLGEKHENVSIECFGLNHLSYFRSVKVKGKEVINEIIDSKNIYTDSEMRFFDPKLVKSLGMLLNGYLYYFYNREQAINNVLKSDKTRGETILEINKNMYEELKNLNIDREFDTIIEIYLKHLNQREQSYMSIESGTKRKVLKIPDLNNFLESNEDGYAGVALNFIESYCTGKQCEMVMLVPNNGSIEGMNEDDVIEVTCHIAKNVVMPIKVGKVPEIQMSLIRQVKLFERLAVDAISEKNIHKAKLALMVHPLVNSYSLASQLVDGYLNVHKEFIGNWS